jgi:hypothetical protein
MAKGLFSVLSRYRRLIGCSFALLLAVALCYLALWISFSWKDYLRPTLAAQQAAGKLGEISRRLSEVSADRLIESGDLESGIGGGSTIYAGASTYQVYEAERSLEATAALYAQFFESIGWQYTEHSRSDYQPMYFQYHGGTWMAIFSEESPNTYRIQLVFSEACETCFFEPMTPPVLPNVTTRVAVHALT